MTVASVTSPRRVTVVAPHTRVDVALPLEATVAEVVQQLTRLVMIDADDPLASSGGWLLTRLGREPFDEEQLVAASGIRDGDLLYLTSRRSRLPAVVFDDVVDAIASAADGRSDRWSPTSTRRAAYAVAGLTTAGAVGGLLTAGPPWSPVATVAGGLALLLLVSAAAVARALGEPALAATTAAAAVGFAALAGLVALAGDRHLLDLGAAQLLLACAALLCCAGLAMVAVDRTLPVLVALALAGGIGVAATAWAALAPQPAGRVAALTAVVVLLGQPLLPVAALRMGRLPFPRLPVDAPEFRRTRPPALDSDVLEQTRRADRALTALVVAVDAVLLVAVVTLLLAPGRAAPALGVVLAAVVLVRARHAHVRPQRTAMLVCGLAGLVLAVALWVHGAPPGAHWAVPLAAVGVAAAAVAYARKAPGRSPSPYWGRTLDVAEFAAAAAVVPLLLAVFDLYSRVRGLAG